MCQCFKIHLIGAIFKNKYTGLIRHKREYEPYRGLRVVKLIQLLVKYHRDQGNNTVEALLH